MSSSSFSSTDSVDLDYESDGFHRRTSSSEIEANYLSTSSHEEVKFISPVASYPPTIPPQYPSDTVAALTRTSCPKRIYPSSFAPGTDPHGTLSYIERNWVVHLRRFILEDLQAGRCGVRLEHTWNIDVPAPAFVVPCKITFDLEPPTVLDHIADVHSWDPRQMSSSRGRFLETLVQNAEWYSPLHLSGSGIKRATEATATFSKPITYPRDVGGFVSHKPWLRPRIYSGPLFGPGTKVTSGHIGARERMHGIWGSHRRSISSSPSSISQPQPNDEQDLLPIGDRADSYYESSSSFSSLLAHSSRSFLCSSPSSTPPSPRKLSKETMLASEAHSAACSPPAKVDYSRDGENDVSVSSTREAAGLAERGEVKERVEVKDQSPPPSSSAGDGQYSESWNEEDGSDPFAILSFALDFALALAPVAPFLVPE